MNDNKQLIRIFLILFIVAIVGTISYRCHKEHPTQKGSGLTTEEFAVAIENYVAKVTEAHGGFFPVRDKVTGETLKLSLVKVHKERLAKVAPEEYFACADFKTSDGKLYDIDIFMKGPDKDNLDLSSVSVHKVEGKERYTWYEEGGVWKQKPVEEVEKQVEHPTEHPEHPAGAEHPTEHPK